MFLSSENCKVSVVAPIELDEVISLTPGIALNCTSSGVATDEAMVWALAPGSRASTWMVGKSTSGSGATGRRAYASAPNSTTATVNSTVPTGCAMHHA